MGDRLTVSRDFPQTDSFFSVNRLTTNSIPMKALSFFTNGCFIQYNNRRILAGINAKTLAHRSLWILWAILSIAALPIQAQNITSTNPARNTNKAPITASPTVQFYIPSGANAGLIPSSVFNSRFNVFSSQYGGSKAGSRVPTLNTIQFNPNQDFKPGEVIRVSVPNTISITSSNSDFPVDSYVYQFTTAAAPAPAVFNGSTLIAANQPAIYKVAVADLNSNGSLDLISVGTTVRTHIRQSNGIYASQVLFNQGVTALQSADMDMDGDLDVVVLYYRPGTLDNIRNPQAQPVGEQTVSIFYNLGNGSFEANAQIINLGPVRSDGLSGLAIADMNGDGQLDIITTRYLNVDRYQKDPYIPYTQYENRVQVNFNSTRNFTAVKWEADLNSGGDLEGVETADMDGDGDLDLQLIHRNNNNVATFRNDGTGKVYTRAADATMQADPSRPVLADMDGDGDLDILAANQAGNTVSIRYNINGGNATNFNGVGVEVPVGSKPSQVVAADVDGDGDLDILTANRESNTVSVRLNVGNRIFTAKADIALNIGGTAADPVDLAVADMDDDGDLDFITTVRGANDVLIRYNDASPFLPTITAVTPQGAIEGDTILISGANFSGLSGIRLNGIAVGVDSIEYVSPSQVKAIVPTGNVYGLVQVTTQNGVSNTNFQLGQPMAVTSLFPQRNALNVPRSTQVKLTYERPVVAGSRVEVFSSQAGGRKTVSLTETVSGNQVTVPTLNFKPGEVVQVIAPRRTMGIDGRSIRPQVYQFTVATGGTGRGNFKPGVDVPSVDQYWGKFVKIYAAPRRFGLIVADLFGYDGKLDVMIPRHFMPLAANTQYFPLYYNNGNGVSFNHPNTHKPNSPFELFLPDWTTFPKPNSHFLGGIAADLFGAGRGSLNIAFTYFSDAVLDAYLMHNIGPGPDAVGGSDDLFFDINYTEWRRDLILPEESVIGPHPTSVEASDMDGNAALDLVVSHQSNLVNVVRNDVNKSEYEVVKRTETQNTTFSRGTKLEVGGLNHKVKTADLDGNGTMDIIVANYGWEGNNGRVYIRLNTGNGNNFTAVPDVVVANHPFDLEVADVDGDGDLDIITSSNTENKVSIRLNNGNATFTGGSDLSFSDKPWDLATGDIDADGDLDIVVAKNDNFVSVRFNDGHGNFSGTTEVSVATGPYSIALADMDDDGDLDIVTANDSSFSVRLNEPFTDLTPIVYARPTIQYGTSPIDVVVDVVEMGNMASSGPITLKINKDALLKLSFVSSLSSLNGHSVENSAWRLSEDNTHYTLSTDQVIAPGDKLSVGLSGMLTPRGTSGRLTVSVLVQGGSGAEVKITNNADADKIEYYQQ